MMTESITKKRVRVSDEDFEKMTKEDLLARWKEQESYVETIESQQKSYEEYSTEIASLRELEEKRRQQLLDASQRESVLLMRLAAKDRELLDYPTQIQELKQAQNAQTSQLRTMLLDPAVNLMFQRMKKELEDSKQRLEQTQNDLGAWKFTPDSQTGKRLMAKCRMLLQENDELGKVVSSGHTAKLDGDIALEKTLVQEMKKSQAEIDEFLLDLDEDVEGMQSTIIILQQQLKEAREENAKLKTENEQLKIQQQTTLDHRTKELCDEVAPSFNSGEETAMDVEEMPASLSHEITPPHSNGDTQTLEQIDRKQSGKYDTTPSRELPRESPIEQMETQQEEVVEIRESDSTRVEEEVLRTSPLPSDNQSPLLNNNHTPPPEDNVNNSPSKGDWTHPATNNSPQNNEGHNTTLTLNKDLSVDRTESESITTNIDNSVVNGLQSSPTLSSPS